MHPSFYGRYRSHFPRLFPSTQHLRQSVSRFFTMPNAAFQCSIPLTAPYAFNTTTPLRRPRTIHRTSFRAKPLHISTSLRACTEIPTPPTTLDVLIPQVAATVDTAIANGHRRLQLTTLIPGLNPQIENTVPYNEELFQQISLQLILSSEKLSQYPTISLLFKSAGTAAAALNQFRKSEIAIPENVNIASYFGRDAAMGKSRIGNANIIVNPASARGNPVFKDLMSLLAEDKDAIWILINPDFSADRAALGMREIEETEMFLASFTSVFYFRNLVCYIH